MKCIKILSFTAVAAAALMAFAGTASTTVLYSGANKVNSGTKVEMTGANFVLKAGFSTITCGHSELDLKTETTGSSTTAVEGNINHLTFTECNATMHVIKNGRLVFHHTSGVNGKVTSIGMEVTVSKEGTSCTYGTPAPTTLGSLDGSTTGDARITVWATLSRVGGPFFCSNPLPLSGTLTITAPTPFHITP